MVYILADAVYAHPISSTHYRLFSIEGHVKVVAASVDYRRNPSVPGQLSIQYPGQIMSEHSEYKIITFCMCWHFWQVLE